MRKYKRHKIKELKPLEVTSEEASEDIGRMIKKFIKKVRRDGVLEDARKREFYEKPSLKKHRKIRKVIFYRKKSQQQNKKKRGK